MTGFRAFCKRVLRRLFGRPTHGKPETPAEENRTPATITITTTVTVTTAPETTAPETTAPETTTPTAAASTNINQTRRTSRASTLRLLNKPLPPLPGRLSPATLGQLLAVLNNSPLSHTHYAVSGLAALAAWGFPDLPLAHVTIICPEADRDVILVWARVAGWYVYPHRPDTIGVPVPPTAAIRKIRIQTVSADTFARLVGFGVVAGRVLALPALLDQYCWHYYFRCVLPLVAPRFFSDARALRDERRLASVILWILNRMVAGAAGEGQVLVPEDVPHVVDEQFLVPFLSRYPQVWSLLEQCGLDGVVLLGAWTCREVVEGDEYGEDNTSLLVEVGVVDEE